MIEYKNNAFVYHNDLCLVFIVLQYVYIKRQSQSKDLIRVGMVKYFNCNNLLQNDGNEK